MVYELHIWGPAFALPSIDPECLAAAAYLKQLLQPDEWVLVPAYDPFSSPNGNFPAFRDGSTWVGGFSAIVEHLKTYRQLGLDNHLSPRQQARSQALAAHISAHALPLIDAVLYASQTNYASNTRPAYTAILPRPYNYTIPPARQSAALARTSPLGLSAADVDDLAHDPADPNNPVTTSHPTTSPSLLFSRRSKQTLHDALASQHTAARFRVESHLEHLLSPIQTLLLYSSSNLLHTPAPTAIDTLAYAHLALLLYPTLPNAAVPDLLRSRFPAVVDYTDRLHAELFGGADFSAGQIMRDPASSPALPWRLPRPPSAGDSLAHLARLGAASLVAPHTARLLVESPWAASHPAASPLKPLVWGAGAAGTLLGLAAWLYRVTRGVASGTHVFGRAETGWARWGDAGGVLSALGNARGGL